MSFGRLAQMVRVLRTSLDVKRSPIRVRYLPYDMISIFPDSQAVKTMDFDSMIGGSNPSPETNYGALVKWSRHLPFTEVTPVQLWYASPPT